MDLIAETLIPVADVARLIPSTRSGRKLNYSTLWRWINHGVRGRRLEVVRVGGGVFTSREALARFSQPSGGPPVATPGKVAARREKEIATAEARLAARGVR